MTNNTAGNPGKSRRKWRGCSLPGVVMTILVLLVLAIVSLLSTFGVWDGAFPDGEFHLQIRDRAGRPVQGAVLNIYKDKSKEPAFKFPFEEYSSQNALISNADGEIIITHKARGIEFGGAMALLFWVIPIWNPDPSFTCEVSAEGYRPYRFSAQQLFELAREALRNKEAVRMKSIQTDGGERQISVLEKVIVLKQK